MFSRGAILNRRNLLELVEACADVPGESFSTRGICRGVLNVAGSFESVVVSRNSFEATSGSFPAVVRSGSNKFSFKELEFSLKMLAQSFSFDFVGDLRSTDCGCDTSFVSTCWCCELTSSLVLSPAVIVEFCVSPLLLFADLRVADKFAVTFIRDRLILNRLFRFTFLNKIFQCFSC